MTIKSTQAEKAQQLHKLHYTGNLLILPNIWDVLGAKLLQDIGYAAVATASAAIAYANGHNDGEHIPFDALLHILKRIAGNVNVPVTADIESGYAANETGLEQNIQQLIKTGIAGINIEDTDKQTNSLLHLDIQCERIKLIKKVALKNEVPLFINARTDTFIHAKSFVSIQQQLDETIKRGMAYKAAGADCFYPILAHNNIEQLQTIVAAVNMPVNVLLTPASPSLDKLQQAGITRASLGPGFLKHAVKAMKDLAIKLLHHEGMEDIAGNNITSEYLKHLVLH
jgi:2-methylisocitrate lyase-like PEP mutase family enzyme